MIKFEFFLLLLSLFPNINKYTHTLDNICRHWLQLGVVLLEQGKSSQALAYLDKALEIDPDHGQALLNSAILLQEIGRPELRPVARDRLKKLLTMDGKFFVLYSLSLHFSFAYVTIDDIHCFSRVVFPIVCCVWL